MAYCSVADIGIVTRAGVAARSFHHCGHPLDHNKLTDPHRVRHPAGPHPPGPPPSLNQPARPNPCLPPSPPPADPAPTAVTVTARQPGAGARRPSASSGLAIPAGERQRRQISAIQMSDCQAPAKPPAQAPTEPVEPLELSICSGLAARVGEYLWNRGGASRRGYQRFVRQGKVTEQGFFAVLDQWRIQYSELERAALWARLDPSGRGEASLADYIAVFDQQLPDGSGAVVGSEHWDPLGEHPQTRGQWGVPLDKGSEIFPAEHVSRWPEQNEHIFPRANALTRHYRTTPTQLDPESSAVNAAEEEEQVVARSSRDIFIAHKLGSGKDVHRASRSHTSHQFVR